MIETDSAPESQSSNVISDYAASPTDMSSFELRVALPADAAALANLLELYAHDFSGFHFLAIGDDGRFGYKSLPLYWSDSNRHPFLIKVNGHLAGLALVKRGSEISGIETVWDLAEFFILRGWRRKRLGTLAAHEVWRRFPGNWEVRVMSSNLPACLFWKHAVSSFTGQPAEGLLFDKNDHSWQLYSFDSPQPGS